METQHHSFQTEYPYKSLKTNLQKVLWVLLDKEWHELSELRQKGGDAAELRVRALRKPWASMLIEMDLESVTHLVRYRLRLETDAVPHVRRILSGELEEPKRQQLSHQ